MQGLVDYFKLVPSSRHVGRLCVLIFAYAFVASTTRTSITELQQDIQWFTSNRSDSTQPRTSTKESSTIQHSASAVQSTAYSGAFNTSDVRFIPPPKPHDHPYPLLLHERDVIHYVNSRKQFASVGSGSFADVTLGQLRAGGAHVVVKSFTDSPFRDILKEIRIHRFVEQLGLTTHVIGLLPAGPMAANISLVYQYLPFSKSLDIWMDEPSVFTTLQWLNICRQVTVNLQVLHENHVLFNDLHRGNILVQHKEGGFTVLFIDFGLATYKHGKLYHLNSGSLKYYRFLAPELANGTRTTTASDVFALGYTFLKTAKAIALDRVYHLAHWCMADDPTDRPKLSEVLAKLDSIIFEISLRNHAHFCNRCALSRLSATSHKIHASECKKSLETFKCSAMTQSDEVDATSNAGDEEDSNEWAWLTGESEILSKRCPVPLFVLDEYDIVQTEPDDVRWLGSGNYDSVRVTELTSDNRSVVVKDFYKVKFDRVRSEACVTAHLGSLGVAPKILGLLIEYKYLKDAAFVQEFYGNGVPLMDFLRFSSVCEWDKRALAKVANGKVNEQTRADHFHDFGRLMDVCESNDIDVFYMLTRFRYKWGNVCLIKSYRQQTLEKISALIIQRMHSAHQAGYLINNFRLNNMVVDWQDLEKGDRISVDVRLIDLGGTSAVSQGKIIFPNPSEMRRYPYMAPEMAAGGRSSVRSDIFSVCHALYLLLQDYFYATDLVLSLATRHKCPQHQNLISGYNNYSAPGKLEPSASEICYGDTKNVLDNAVLGYQKYQSLLLKCLKSSPAKRPYLHALSQMVNELRLDNRGFDLFTVF